MPISDLCFFKFNLWNAVYGRLLFLPHGHLDLFQNGFSSVDPE